MKVPKILIFLIFGKYRATAKRAKFIFILILVCTFLTQEFFDFWRENPNSLRFFYKQSKFQKYHFTKLRAKRARFIFNLKLFEFSRSTQIIFWRENSNSPIIIFYKPCNFKGSGRSHKETSSGTPGPQYFTSFKRFSEKKSRSC